MWLGKRARTKKRSYVKMVDKRLRVRMVWNVMNRGITERKEDQPCVFRKVAKEKRKEIVSFMWMFDGQQIHEQRE